MTGSHPSFGVNLMPSLWDGKPGVTGRELLARRRRLLGRISEAGLDHVMLGDHVMFQSGLGNDGMVDAASALTANEELAVYLAVYLLVLRHPLLVARQLLTLAQLAPGRLSLGVGIAGDDRREVAACGVDPRTRGRRMDELIQALLACWGPDPVSFEGEFFTIPPSDVRPKPVQQPHPPLLSGMWSAAGLRRTVEHFDIWNPARGTPAQLRAQVDELNADRPAGRDPLRLFYRSFAQRPSHKPGNPVPGVDGVVADVRSAVEAGVEEVIVECNFWQEIDSPKAWAEAPEKLLPALAAAS
jgi:alkanesulfonate monooxygenase SsuD/methylene tetrahydromethanopterin reductase-like flavin-dependent oxidoreductase (luciferase family)